MLTCTFDNIFRNVHCMEPTFPFEFWSKSTGPFFPRAFWRITLKFINIWFINMQHTISIWWGKSSWSFSCNFWNIFNCNKKKLVFYLKQFLLWANFLINKGVTHIYMQSHPVWKFQEPIKGVWCTMKLQVLTR